MTIEWLGEESGLWFGMMIEGVVAVSFSGRALHCVPNLSKNLGIRTHYPEHRMLIRPWYCACYIRTSWIVSPQKEPANSPGLSWSDLIHCYCMILTATCEDHRESDCLHHCGTERRREDDLRERIFAKLRRLQEFH